MNRRSKRTLTALSRAGRTLWKLYGLAWLIVLIPVVGYTGIALSLAIGTLYFAYLGPVGGIILPTVTITIVLLRRKIGRAIMRHFQHNYNLVVCEVCVCACFLFVAVLLHLPLSPLWCGLASLLANTLLEGRGGASIELSSNHDKPLIHVETLLWLWFGVAWLLLLAYGAHTNHTTATLLVVNLGLVLGSFLEALRKYILLQGSGNSGTPIDQTPQIQPLSGGN